MKIHSLPQPVQLPQSAFIVWKKLKDHGYDCFCAGGFVRDLLLNQKSDDVDLATNASPDQVSLLFPKTLPLGKRFGSVVVLIKEQDMTHGIEVTTFRSDGLYLDGRRPESVTPSNPEEDASRRDFSINGLFYDPETSVIIDFVGGLEDLEKGCLRAIGDPWKRFEEDRLRILRGVRFAARLNYEIEPVTFEAMKALSYSVSHCVSAERIWQELTKTDQDLKFKEAMLLFYRLGLLEYLFGLDIDPLFLQKRLSEIPVFLPLVLKLTLLWSHETLFSKDCLLKLSELKISRKDLFLLEQVEKGLMWLDTKADPLISLEMIQWAQKSGDDLDSLSLVLSILRAEKASKIFWKLLLEHPLTSYLRERGPLFKAGDLIPYQIPPGKKMGALLHWLHEQAAKHQSIDKAYLLSLLEKEQEGQFLLMEAQKGNHS